MQSGLFRKEVLSTRRNEWLGSIRLTPPRAGWIFFVIGLLILAACFLLLFFGRYTRHEHVVGTLVPSNGLLMLTPAAGGIATQVLVHEGERVRAGQPLLEISGEQNSATLGRTHAAITAELEVKRARLLADLAAQQHLALQQKQDLYARLQLLRGQIAAVDEQTALQKDRAKSTTALYQLWLNSGSTGAVSKLQLLQQQDAALQSQAQVKDLQRQGLELRQQAQVLQAQLEQLPIDAAGKRNEIERQLADVAQSSLQNEVQRAAILSAPADGVIAGILVHAGQPVSAQQTTITLLPENSSLLAELWVPSKAIGFIATGQRVTIRYQAYPYQKFGMYAGTVTEVSRSTLPASEVSRLLGQNVSNPRYRVQVALEHQDILAYGRRAALKPGMSLDAEIALDNRRLIEWVIDPLASFTQPLQAKAHG